VVTLRRFGRATMSPVSKRADDIERSLSERFQIPVYYSINTWAKWFINTAYRNKKHYVWSSDAFSGSRFGFPVAPSSTPKEIYRELQRDVQGRDKHSVKINQQRATLVALCAKWFRPENLEHQEILHFLNDGDFNKWRPLIYVIPQYCIALDRVRVVGPTERAGMAREYIISDLDESEFDLIEP
jgi:hypothetical protein